MDEFAANEPGSPLLAKKDKRKDKEMVNFQIILLRYKCKNVA